MTTPRPESDSDFLRQVASDGVFGDQCERLNMIAARLEALENALVALYTYPRVQDLLAPRGSLGSIMDQVESALKHQAGEGL